MSKVDLTNDHFIETPKNNQLQNCYLFDENNNNNYNNNNEEGPLKNLRKKDIYNQNFWLMYRKLINHAKFPILNSINSFILETKLCKFESVLITTLSGPEDSSSDGLFSFFLLFFLFFIVLFIIYFIFCLFFCLVIYFYYLFNRNKLNCKK